MTLGHLTTDALLLAAVSHHQAGRFDDANGHYEEILRRNPVHFDATHLKGVLAGQRNQLDLGIALIRKAVSIDPSSADAFANLGKLLYEKKAYAEAVVAYAKAADLNPAVADRHVALGISLRMVNRTQDALSAFEKALFFNPGLVEAHAGAARCFKELNNLESSSVLFRRAIALDPQNLDLRIELGNVLATLGQPEEALREFAYVIQLRPTDESALLNAATVLHRLERLEEALWTYDQLLTVRVADFDVYLRRGLVLLQMGRVSDAVNSHKTALSLAPKEIRVYEALGATLAEQRDLRAAEEVFRSALAIDSRSPTSLAGLGFVLAGLGHFVEAGQFSRKALQLSPRNMVAQSVLARIGQIAHEDAGHLSDQVNDDALSTDARIAAGFALGKQLDEADSFDEAFEVFKQANQRFMELQASQGVRFNPEKLTLQVNWLISRFTTDFIARASGGVTDEAPVFIVGMPRSGTSLTEQIVASHSKVFGAGELTHLHEYGVELEPKFDGLQYPPAAISQIAQRHIAHLQQLGNSASRVVDKLPANVFELGLIAILFPNARIIFVDRDARDTCLSCYFTSFVSNHIMFSYDLKHCATQYLEQQRLIAHWKRTLKLRFCTIVYEELVADLEGQSRKLIEFLGLEWEPACLDFYKTQRAVHTASVWQVRQPIYTRSVGRWKHYEKHLAPLLQALADGDPSHGI